MLTIKRSHYQCFIDSHKVDATVSSKLIAIASRLAGGGEGRCSSILTALYRHPCNVEAEKNLNQLPEDPKKVIFNRVVSEKYIIEKEGKKYLKNNPNIYTPSEDPSMPWTYLENKKGKEELDLKPVGGGLFMTAAKNTNYNEKLFDMTKNEVLVYTTLHEVFTAQGKVLNPESLKSRSDSVIAR